MLVQIYDLTPDNELGVWAPLLLMMIVLEQNPRSGNKGDTVQKQQAVKYGSNWQPALSLLTWLWPQLLLNTELQTSVYRVPRVDQP